MAWTEPKTWVNQDPLNESNFNTFIRDNQVALKAQADDSTNKLSGVYPAHQSPLLVGYAVIGASSQVSNISSTTYVLWHAKCKLTFTPKTDMVLFGVQCSIRKEGPSGSHIINFGLRKGDTNFSLAHTAVVDGSLGSTTDIEQQEVSNRFQPFLIFYQAPVPVTRDTEVTISPTVKMESGSSFGLFPSSVMVLTALDVGSYE